MPSYTKAKDSSGSYWEIRWRGPDGSHKKRRRKKAAADRLYAFALEQEEHRREPLAYRPVVDVTLGFVIDRWWDANFEAWHGGTRANREGVIKNHIPPAWKSRPLRHFHPGEIQDLLKKLSSRYGRDLVSTVRSVLNLVWGQALLEGWAEINPVEKTKVPKKRGHRETKVEKAVDPKLVLSADQIHQIADSMTHPPYRGLVLTLGVAGLRIGEAATLQVKHLDFENRIIQVEQARDASPKRHRIDNGIKPPKNGDSRKVSLSRALADELEPLAMGRDPEDWVFTSVEGMRMDVDNFRTRYWTPVVSRLGFREGPREFVTPHWLRHTSATVMLKKGVNPGNICDELGWADLQILFQRYAGFFSADKEEVRKAQDEAWAR